MLVAVTRLWLSLFRFFKEVGMHLFIWIREQIIVFIPQFYFVMETKNDIYQKRREIPMKETIAAILAGACA